MCMMQMLSRNFYVLFLALQISNSVGHYTFKLESIDTAFTQSVAAKGKKVVSPDTEVCKLLGINSEM